MCAIPVIQRALLQHSHWQEWSGIHLLYEQSLRHSEGAHDLQQRRGILRDQDGQGSSSMGHAVSVPVPGVQFATAALVSGAVCA